MYYTGYRDRRVARRGGSWQAEFSVWGKSYRNNGPVRSLSTANVPVYEHNDVVGYIPCAIFGMADASIAVCNLLNGEPQVVIVPAGCEDPITNMLIIDQNGIAPIPKGPCKRISKIFELVTTPDNHDEKSVEEGNSDLRQS